MDSGKKKCDFCSSYFGSLSSKSALYSHVNSVHKEEVQKSDWAHCKACDWYVPTASALARHNGVSHKNQKSSKKKISVKRLHRPKGGNNNNTGKASVRKSLDFDECSEDSQGSLVVYPGSRTNEDPPAVVDGSVVIQQTGNESSTVPDLENEMFNPAIVDDDVSSDDSDADAEHPSIEMILTRHYFINETKEEMSDNPNGFFFPSIGPYMCEICRKVINENYKYVKHIRKRHLGHVEESILAIMESRIQAERAEKFRKVEISSGTEEMAAAKNATSKSDDTESADNVFDQLIKSPNAKSGKMESHEISSEQLAVSSSAKSFEDPSRLVIEVKIAESLDQNKSSRDESVASSAEFRGDDSQTVAGKVPAGSDDRSTQETVEASNLELPAQTKRGRQGRKSGLQPQEAREAEDKSSVPPFPKKHRGRPLKIMYAQPDAGPQVSMPEQHEVAPGASKRSTRANKLEFQVKRDQEIKPVAQSAKNFKTEKAQPQTGAYKITPKRGDRKLKDVEPNTIDTSKDGSQQIPDHSDDTTKEKETWGPLSKDESLAMTGEANIDQPARGQPKRRGRPPKPSSPLPVDQLKSAAVESNAGKPAQDSKVNVEAMEEKEKTISAEDEDVKNDMNGKDKDESMVKMDHPVGGQPKRRGRPPKGHATPSFPMSQGQPKSAVTESKPDTPVQDLAMHPPGESNAVTMEDKEDTISAENVMKNPVEVKKVAYGKNQIDQQVPEHDDLAVKEKAPKRQGRKPLKEEGSSSRTKESNPSKVEIHNNDLTLNQESNSSSSVGLSIKTSTQGRKRKPHVDVDQGIDGPAANNETCHVASKRGRKRKQPDVETVDHQGAIPEDLIHPAKPVELDPVNESSGVESEVLFDPVVDEVEETGRPKRIVKKVNQCK